MNEKPKIYLNNIEKKTLIPFSQKILNINPLFVCLMQHLLAFDPKDCSSANKINLVEPSIV